MALPPKVQPAGADDTVPAESVPARVAWVHVPVPSLRAKTSNAPDWLAETASISEVTVNVAFTPRGAALTGAESVITLVAIVRAIRKRSCRGALGNMPVWNLRVSGP